MPLNAPDGPGSKGVAIPGAPELPVQPWNGRGHVHHGGSICGLLDWPGPGRCLADLVNSDLTGAREGLRILLEALGRPGCGPELFVTGVPFLHAVFLQDDGAVRVLPRDMQTMLLANLPVEERFLSLDAWRHPGLKGREAWNFSLWAMAFASLTGALPFPDQDRTRYGSCMIHGLCREPATLVEDLSDEDARLMQDSLSRPGAALSRGFSVVAGLLARAGRPSLRAEVLSPTPAWQGKLRRFEAGRTLRGNSGKIILIGLIALFALSIPVTALLQAMKPSLTAGMDAREVLDAYFRARRTHDSDLLEDCLAPGYRKEQVEEATNLTVMRKIRMAAEKREMALDPVSWEQEGRNPVERGWMLHGPGAVSITDLGEDSGSRTFRAEYRWYSNLSSSRDDETTGSLITKVEDTPYRQIFRLTLVNGEWRIDSILPAPDDPEAGKDQLNNPAE